MKRTRYTMPARSQGGLHMQRRLAVFIEEDAHRQVFAHDMAPDVETLVLARTHLVSNDTPPLHAMTRTDEAGKVNARGLNAGDAAKAIIEATGSNPHMSVCGWPFCLDDLDGVA